MKDKSRGKDPVNILMLTTHINLGGVARYIYDLSNGLRKLNMNVHVASAGGNMRSDFEHSRIPLVDVDVLTKFEFHPKLIAAASVLSGFIKAKKIDIIHCHTRVGQVLGSIVSKMSKTPFVSTCHGFFRAERISRKLVPCWGKGVIAISDAVSRHLQDDFKLSSGKIAVIYNGINAENYPSAVPIQERERLMKDCGLSDGPVVGSIGRLSSVKGYDHLIQAFNRVKDNIPGASLCIIGKGPEEDRLKRLIKGLNLENRVSLMNARFDARTYLPIMDVYVSSSIQEGLGLALLEAMAAERPCVATNVGGIPTIVDDGTNGILVDPMDDDSLAIGIRDLLKDKPLARRLGKAARETILSKFSFDEMLDKTVNFYKRIISGGI